MTEIISELQLALQDLLSGVYAKTAALLTEELRVEYPELYQSIVTLYAQEYSVGGCGAQMSPLTLVSQTLSDLYAAGCAHKISSRGNILWRKK